MEKFRTNIILLFSISLLVHTGFGIVFPIYPKLLKLFGKSAIDLGILTASFGFAYVIFSPLFGSWADKYGKKKIIVIGLVGFATSNIVYILAIYTVKFELLLLARAMEGAFASAVFPAAIAIVSDSVPEGEIAKNIGIVTAGNGIGMIIGPIIGGYLFTISIEFTFYVSAILAVITLFWTISTLQISEINLTHSYKSVSSKQNNSLVETIMKSIKILPDPKFIFFIFIFVDMSFIVSWMLLEPGLSYYFYDELRLTPIDFGLFIALYSLFASIGGGLFGGLSDKHGRRPIIIGGMMINALFYYMMMFATNLTDILVASIIGGLSLGFVGPAMKALLSNASLKENRATIFGIASGLSFIGSIFGPILGGYLFDSYSIFILFNIAIFVSLLGAFLSLFLTFESN